MFGDLNSDFITFFSNDIGLNSITLDNINLDDNNFDYWDTETISHIKLMAEHNRYKQLKASKKDKWRISIVYNKSMALAHARKWKNEVESILIDWWKLVISFETILVNIRISGQFWLIQGFRDSF